MSLCDFDFKTVTCKSFDIALPLVIFSLSPSFQTRCFKKGNSGNPGLVFRHYTCAMPLPWIHTWWWVRRPGEDWKPPGAGPQLGRYCRKATVLTTGWSRPGNLDASTRPTGPPWWTCPHLRGLPWNLTSACQLSPPKQTQPPKYQSQWSLSVQKRGSRLKSVGQGLGAGWQKPRGLGETKR